MCIMHGNYQITVQERYVERENAGACVLLHKYFGETPGLHRAEKRKSIDNHECSELPGM